MSQTSSVPPSGFLRFLALVEDGAQTICGALLAIIFLSMVIVGGLEVTNRSLFSFSLSWSEEFQRYGQAWLVFLSIPFAYSRAYHIGMNFLADRFSAGARYALALSIDIAWAGLGVIMIVSGYRIVTLGWIQKSAGMGVSMAAVYSVIIISGAYMLILAARRLIERLRRAERRHDA